MENFEVIYDGDYYDIRSKVYAIDPIKDRFLIVKDGRFKWVFTVDCSVVEGDERCDIYDR
jgi:hypothetical protein